VDATSSLGRGIRCDRRLATFIPMEEIDREFVYDFRDRSRLAGDDNPGE
jgi:hypothetical protein